MLKKLSIFVFACFIVLNFSGCASVPTAASEPKELKLKWNVSYLRGLVLVKGALKDEQIQFENAVISKDAAKLKGNYADGRTLQIVISKISNFESSVAVNVGASQTAREDVRRILEAVAEYSKKK